MDAGDASCAFQHQGVVWFNSSQANFIDLNQATGANSSGYALPGYVGGAGAGLLSEGTAGWSFEATVRPWGNFGNAKIASLGAGAPYFNIFLSQDGTNDGGLNFGLYDGNTVSAVDYSAGHSGILELVNPYVINEWYHIVAVLQQVTSASLQENNVTHGAWFMYVNGQLIGYTSGVSQDNMNPSAVPRPFSYLGKSDWNDPAWQGLIDTFRIYNYALTGAQVGQLYAGEMGGCAVPISTTPPTTATPNLLPRTTSGAVTPLLLCHVHSEPSAECDGSCGLWLGTEPRLTDNASNQAVHQGLLTLNGTAQFVNLALPSGANSIGQVLPTIGGGSAGWTVEIMMLSTTGADTWPKVYDIGSIRSNNPLNDIVLGWDGNSGAPDHFWQFEVIDNTTAGNGWQTPDAIGEVPYNTWIHAVAVITPTANGNANYFLYVNGQLYTTVTNAFYPVAAVRQNAYIGKSGWSDPYFTGAVDFFNVYSQALSDVQVSALYTAATQPVTATIANATLCFIMYSLPGNIDYPWSVALNVQLYYNTAPVTTSAGVAVQVLNGTGTRTYNNRFGDSFSTRITLSAAGSTSDQLLYVGSSVPVDAQGLSYVLASPVQLPGLGPTQLLSELSVYGVVGGIAESGATRTDQFGQSYSSSIPGFTSVSIGASNLNSLAVQPATCQAPISFTNGLRPPTQPSVSNGATNPTFSYTISDGLTYSIQANLSLTAQSAFASTKDMLGNPYQSVINIQGTRTYTYLPTGATLVFQYHRPELLSDLDRITTLLPLCTPRSSTRGIHHRHCPLPRWSRD